MKRLVAFLSSHLHRGFAHPFKDGWIPNRLDMGYDGTFKNKIYAPFSGRVMYAGPFNGWNGSLGVIIRCHRSLWWLPTRCLYFTEGCAPLVKSGEYIKAGQPIAYAVNSPYGDSYGHGAKGAIEWGVAASGPIGQQTDAYASVLGTGSNSARRMVLTFSDGMHKDLGVKRPSSTSNAGSP